MALSSFWDTSSPIGEWVAACCDLSDKSARTLSKTLYESFRAFRLEAGDKEDRIPTHTALGIALNKLQIYSQANSKGLKERVGIVIKDGAAPVGLQMSEGGLDAYEAL
jgi:hypothetical protein